MNGSRLTVQFARGSRQRDFPAPDRTHPRPRRTAYRMQISGLPGETSWQVSSLLHYVCSWPLVLGSMEALVGVHLCLWLYLGVSACCALELSVSP